MKYNLKTNDGTTVHIIESDCTLILEKAIEDKSVDLSNISDNKLRSMITVRLFEEFKDKAFCLSPIYNWELKKDSRHILCLVPTKKDKLCLKDLLSI
jgi:hypothetical protein